MWSQCDSQLEPFDQENESNLRPSSTVNRQISELRDKFDWPSFGKGKVVDVGGGSGHVSIALARVSFPGDHYDSLLQS